MGRTLPSAMMVFDAEAARWSKFRRALRREDQELFDELVLDARRNIAALAYSSPAAPMEGILLAMLLGERRAVRVLEEKVRRLESGAGPIALRTGMTIA
jgi:hypothetical protein